MKFFVLQQFLRYIEMYDVDGLVQGRYNSSALAMELRFYLLTRSC